MLPHQPKLWNNAHGSTSKTRVNCKRREAQDVEIIWAEYIV